jgi:hypothetical protein
LPLLLDVEELFCEKLFKSSGEFEEEPLVEQLLENNDDLVDDVFELFSFFDSFHFSSITKQFKEL